MFIIQSFKDLEKKHTAAAVTFGVVVLLIGLVSGHFGSRAIWPVDEVEVTAECDAEACRGEIATATAGMVTREACDKENETIMAKYSGTTSPVPAEKPAAKEATVNVNFNSPIISDAALAKLCAGRGSATPPTPSTTSPTPTSAPPGTTVPAAAACPTCPACPTPTACVTCSCCPSGSASATPPDPAVPPLAAVIKTPTAPVTKEFEVAASRTRWLDTGIPATKVVKVEAKGTVYIDGEVIRAIGKSSSKSLFYKDGKLGELIGGDNASKWIRPTQVKDYSKYVGNLYLLVNNLKKRGKDNCGHFTVAVTYTP